MDYENAEQLCLKGSLILADPSLRDPGFGRSVILLTNHSHDEGAMGFILNKPIRRKVGDVAPDDGLTRLGDVDVYLGGPVSPERLCFASLAWDAGGSRLDFATHLSPDEARHRLEEGFDVRAYIGYSGWSEGQLESELQQRAWIATRPDKLAMETARCDRMWHDLLTGMGPYFALLANMPEDPSLN